MFKHSKYSVLIISRFTNTKKTSCIEQLVIENDKYLISWYGKLHKHQKLFLTISTPNR